MKYSSLVVHATEIETCFLSPKQGDLQILFLVGGRTHVILVDVFLACKHFNKVLRCNLTNVLKLNRESWYLIIFLSPPVNRSIINNKLGAER